MLERARALAAEKGIANVTWQEGEVERLPYPDGAFTIVVTRFAMHHFLDPAAVFREMVRVCAPGGRIVVVDTYTSEDPAKAAAFEDASLGIPVRRAGEELEYAYPVAILAADRR